MTSKRLFRQHGYTIETRRSHEGWAWAVLAVLAALGVLSCSPLLREPAPADAQAQTSQRAYEAGRVAELEQGKLRAAQSYRKGWEDALRARATEDALRAQGGR